MKQKKIDTRLDDYLFALVDAFAKRHGLKRTQVIIRALEEFFGLEQADPKAFARTQGKTFAQSQGKAHPQDQQGNAGAKTLKASANFDSTPSTATKKSSRPAG